jgi:hypothetical protein
MVSLTPRQYTSTGGREIFTGAYNRSAIGALVERSRRFTILCTCPTGGTPPTLSGTPSSRASRSRRLPCVAR